MIQDPEYLAAATILVTSKDDKEMSEEELVSID